MAYNSKYLLLVHGAPGNGSQIWSYRDTATPAAVAAAGYISDGKKQGMRLGDTVLYTQVDDQATPTSLTKQQIMVVNTLNADGSARLGDGTAITETNA